MRWNPRKLLAVHPRLSRSFIPVFEESRNRTAPIDAPRLDFPKLVDVDLDLFLGLAAGEREQRKGLRPILFNPCSAPATPAQTWGTRPEGEKGADSPLYPQTTGRIKRNKS